MSIELINEYIAARNDLFVEGISRLDKIGTWIPTEQIIALMAQTSRIVEDLKVNSKKLYDYTVVSTDISESILRSASNKIAFIENTITMLSSLYGQKQIVGNVSVVNLTSGEFNNMIYSSTDGGLIMEYQYAN